MNVSPISSTSPTSLWQLEARAPVETPSDESMQVREKFQDFVAGTFYKQMLKSLRATHDKAAYFHGGPAEEMFQGQLDQYVSEDLARHQGAGFSDPLFSAFSQHLHRSQAKFTLPASSLPVVED